MDIEPFKVLLINYEQLKSQEDLIKKEIEKYRKEIVFEMHNQKVNEVTIELDNSIWKCSYQQRTTTSINYELLRSIVGEERYSEIVSKNESSSFYIRQVKKDEDEKLRKAPKNNTHQKIPVGTLI